MSYNPRSPMVHPFTFFIVNCIQIVWNDVSQGPTTQIREATRDLYWLCCCLDAKGQQTLTDEITFMEQVLDGMVVLNLQKFRILLKKVMKELHEEGYFLAAKMRPPTREVGMQELELETAKAKYGK
jgi:hypothetical protein